MNNKNQYFNYFKKLLNNTSFLLILSLIFSIVYPNFSFYLKPYLMFLLIIMMSFSLKGVNINLNKIKKKFYLKEMAFLSLINYIFLPIVIIGSSFLLLKNENFINGFIIMAAVPCAIIVITFTKLLNKDVFLSVLGLYFNYFLSLILSPLIIWLFLRQKISLIPVLNTIFLLTILPMVLSKLTEKADKKILKNKLEKYDKIIINLIFFITTYAFVGIYVNKINNLNFFDLKEIFLILTIKTFFLSLFFIFIRRNYVYALFANYKNLGYAIVLALTLLNEEAALPSVIGIFFDNVLFLVFGILNRKLH